MQYGYDLFGWYIGTYPDKVRKRSTPIEPVNKSLSAQPGQLRSNWSGVEWVEKPYSYADIPTPDTTNRGRIDPVRFQTLFTLAERVAIRAAISTDANIAELCRLLDDPRTKEVDLSLPSNVGALDYLVAQGFITADRKAEILNGIVQ